MQELIPPIDRRLLLAELGEGHFVRQTNNGNNEIYIVDAHSAPQVMQEIGRLRELSFREAGGGTGKSADIDRYDTMPLPFQQLIVWNPEEQEIVGGYRFIHCRDLEIHEGAPQSPTSRLFRLSERFIGHYMPYTIELGRSFVQPAYQPAMNIRKGMYSLDNLWDGLGALVVDHPDIRWFFGKITMYPHFNTRARDLIQHFLRKYFPDPDELVRPFVPMALTTPSGELEAVFSGGNYEADYKLLVQQVRSLGEGIPPLVNAYMNLSSTMRTFGTAINEVFGDVEETGIMVTINDIYEAKKDRHVNTYRKGM
ncbi:MAG TPA: GNAT family N-acetyltransferase [Bacteroidales bacterium]|nr:GNAT family N-acetyltransferase [Bacteroidales bacterium]HRZ75942.1 GNAT family N-acetyltransferase [Bacteroidales bacterium]